MPSIYNANIERYHWTIHTNNIDENIVEQNHGNAETIGITEQSHENIEDIVVKQEPINFLNQDGLIWIADDADISGDDLIANSNDNVEATAVGADDCYTLHGHVKIQVNFPNLPNEIIELTTDDVIRTIVSFNADVDADMEGQIANEVEFIMKWDGIFALPVKKERAR